jgi:hypothetical protein
MRFLESYCSKVDAIDMTDPFYKWYAQSAKFYNANGIIYNSGEEIWSWMSGLFGQFAAVHHDIHVIRLFSASSTEAPPDRAAQYITLETNTKFSLEEPIAAGGPIAIPRFLMFLVGKSELAGQGTDGLQILEARAWWDSGVLQQEITKRKQQVAGQA